MHLEDDILEESICKNFNYFRTSEELVDIWIKQQKLGEPSLQKDLFY